ncbi:MAG: hypothetical protein KGL04_05510 [Elusimicrobia bacterium]|nr:hypothetical protein [Elusimicrobiota bacterium]
MGRRARQYEKYTGEFFVYGWLAIAILIFFADSLVFGMSWPVNLYETLAVVWGVYLGVKFAAPAIWPIVPDDENNPENPGRPAAAQPRAGPAPSPAPAFRNGGRRPVGALRSRARSQCRLSYSKQLNRESR